MHEMDWTIVDHRCLDLALRELVRQLDERYVKREEQHYHIEIDDPHGFLNDEPEPPTRLSGTMEPEAQPKATCECVDDSWITDLMDCWDHAYPKFCCYCGLPLPHEEEKP